MDGTGGHYIKCNKPDRKRHRLYDITDMWNLKNTTNYSKTKVKIEKKKREQTQKYR